jgi:hypothetical protein
MSPSPPVCPLGHMLTHGRCIACDKRAKAKPRVVRPCELHSDCVTPCPRCAKAKAENARELARQTPWYTLQRDGERKGPTPEMIEQHRRMFAPNATMRPIEKEDHE